MREKLLWFYFVKICPLILKTPLHLFGWYRFNPQRSCCGSKILPERTSCGSNFKPQRRSCASQDSSTNAPQEAARSWKLANAKREVLALVLFLGSTVNASQTTVLRFHTLLTSGTLKSSIKCVLTTHALN